MNGFRDDSQRRLPINSETSFMKRVLSLLVLLFNSDLDHLKFFKIFILGRRYKISGSEPHKSIEVKNERGNHFGFERLVTIAIFVIIPFSVIIFLLTWFTC
jgi:hypothetical protein